MKLGLYINKNKENLKVAIDAIFEIFCSDDDKVLFLNEHEYIANELNPDYECITDNDYDVLIAIGGDGTIISAIRSQYHFNRPIMGFHVGHLGFLSECDLDNYKEVLQEIKNGEYTTQERSVFEVSYKKGNKEVESIAINDVVIDRGESGRIMRADIFDGKTLVNSYEGDGLIISTANGSTAYSLSAGGPIISPNLNLLTITPICSHSLTTRTIVLSEQSDLSISFPDKKTTRTLTIDGQINLNILDSMIINVKIANKKVNFILTEKSNYYQKLRTKMGWYSSKK